MSFPGVYADTGVFVCFEGGDGSGKSTQSRRLREATGGGGSRGPADLRAGGHPGRSHAARDRAQPRDRRALRPHRDAGLRRRQGRARRHRRLARAAPWRDRGHRPLRRLHAGLPGGRARARRSPGSSRSPAGPPATCAPISPSSSTSSRSPAWAASRAATGSRVSRWSSTNGSGTPSSRWRPTTPTTTSWSTPALPRRGDRGAGARPGPAAAGPRGGGHVSVWDDLVGQRRAAEALREAAAGARHEPRLAVHGSARLRSVQRGGRVRRRPPVRGGSEPGCGTCHACHTVLAGSHADVDVRSAPRASRSASTRSATWSGASALTPVGQALADHHRRGRRPAHRARGATPS